MKRTFSLILALVVLAPATTVEDFTAVDLEGRTWSLDSLLGDDLTVFSFWSTSCTLCEDLLGLLDSLYVVYADSGLAVVSVNTDTERTVREVEPMVDSQGWDFIVIMDTEGELMGLFDVGPLPHTFYVKPGRKIQSSFMGYTASDASSIRKAICNALRED
ncbi:redoxin domain-containing protein [candidate division WOR-3 bacterium]|uniref:Redoxin domain-containing protein n=1 Tax=candidate division WOR-3 bacterium TaxID=2052148 RepID=A0A9D5QDC0_UNCW3|nr:redoxin domain-containing protein [candidate division WOR-3 bacterium]MBD3365459.1 redoxin domain-containing protein [candidate division WOR-3 bacterium]